MEDTKKMDEAAKPEDLAERVELTDEELDQASGGKWVSTIAEGKLSDQTNSSPQKIIEFLENSSSLFNSAAN